MKILSGISGICASSVDVKLPVNLAPLATKSDSRRLKTSSFTSYVRYVMSP